jgi:predicted O-linked N-acetylglucosamine transferase (SPINDLY family)
LNQRGCELGARGHHEAALACFEQALALQPDFAEALANCAVALQSLPNADPARALAVFDRVLAKSPSLAEVRNNRGSVLRELGRVDEAIADYDVAIALRPEFAEAHCNRAKALAALGRHEEALASFDRALALQPQATDAQLNRGASLAALRRHAEAARDFARALAANPRLPAVPGLLFHARANACDWVGRDEAAQRLVADARSGRRSASPFVMLSVTDCAADQAACARTWARQTLPAVANPLWRGERYDHARVRVAYLSSDFDEHAVSFLLAGVIERHDRARFETIALSSGYAAEGAMRTRLRRAFEHFVDVRGCGDREVAARIREVEADIVIDLNGYTQGSRTGALGFRPAPVAVNYLGYPGTLGTTHADYIIADRFAIPEVRQHHYAEKVAYLPDTFQANGRDRAPAAVTPTREECGLPARGAVLCAFGNSYKITPALFDAWMRVLARSEGSVLWLLGGSAPLPQNLAREAQRRGVDPSRLVFAPRLPYADHLARLRLADVFLDTHPFNGGATASDALWAGVPVVTLAGEALASRMAGSLLHALGLPGLVATSLDDYEALALRLAADASAHKAALAQRREAQPLFDSERFCRHLESAYATMQERAQRGDPPAAFAVSASSGA